MRISKSLEKLYSDFRGKENNPQKVYVTAEDLWKIESERNNGKSIATTGINPDREKQLHRMEADRLEGIADRIANMGVYAMISGDNLNSKTLMSRAEEIRRVSDLHRRQAELL